MEVLLLVVYYVSFMGRFNVWKNRRGFIKSCQVMLRYCLQVWLENKYNLKSSGQNLYVQMDVEVDMNLV